MAMNYGSFGYDGGGAATGNANYQGSGSYDYGGGDLSESSRPSNFRPGDWMCSCGAHNYAYRATCKKCSNPKPESGGASGRFHDRSRDRGAEGEYHRRGREQSRSRSRDRFEYRRRDNSRSRSRSRDRGYGGYGGYRGGEYSGRGRGRSNICYAFQRGDCRFGHSCRFDHVDGDGDRRGAFDRFKDRGRGGYRDRPRSGSYEDRGGGGGRFRKDRGPRNKLRSGDWWCPVCQIHKFGFRDDCEKCGSQKTEEAVAEVERIMKKNEEDGLPPSFRPGDWMCPVCKNHIFGRHDTCSQCNTLKPVDGTAWGTVPDAAEEGAGNSAEKDPERNDGSDQASVNDDDEKPVVAEAA